MKIILLILFFSISLIGGQENQIVFEFDLSSSSRIWICKWHLKSGDSLNWSIPDFDDSDWLLSTSRQFKKPDPGIHWYRSKIKLAGELKQIDGLLLHISDFPVAFQVFWDGIKVGENGKVGNNPLEERPGDIFRLIKLPLELTTPGNHLLSIRFSNFNIKKRYPIPLIQLSFLEDFFNYQTDYLFNLALWIGIKASIMVISLALFFGGGRHRPYIIFALYNFLLLLFYGSLALTHVSPINVNLLYLHQDFLFAVYFVVQILLNVFFIYIFDIPAKRIHISFNIFLPLLIVIVNIQSNSDFELRDVVMLLYGIGILFFAVRHRRAGSLIALIGLLSFSIPYFYINLRILFQFPYQLSDQVFILTSFFFAFCIIFSISRQIREQNILFEETKLRSHRLETQLLKSQIQPHFISNTLHSIKSWFREEPKKAEKLIQTLADEFRIINEISSKSLIPLKEEILLCRHHLEIMGSRRDVRFKLITHNMPVEVMIPPLIFHTLIENGLTHAYLPRENGKFWLTYEEGDSDHSFKLKNDGSQLKQFSQQEQTDIEEGLGLAYAKARLEESFPSKWEIEYGLQDGLWEVSIHIKK